MSKSSVTYGEDTVPVHPHANKVVMLKTCLLLLAVNLIYFTQLVNIVGSGALTQDVAAAVGGASTSIWYTQVIAIFTVVLSIPVSQAADLWGRKVFLVSLTACGCVGAIVVSRAVNASGAIAGFSITGISYGAQPLLHAIVSEVLARKYRPWAQASVNVSASLGAICGLLVGGALTRYNNSSGFRIYWYMVAGIYAVTTVVCQLLYNPGPRALQLELTTREKVARLDWVGYAIFTPALVLFCMSLAWSQNPYPWSDAHVSATFSIGLALAVALVVYEWRGRRDGMFHHDLFAHRNFALALLCVFAEGVVFFCANNFFAYEVSVLFSTDSLVTGAHYCIAFVMFAVSAIFTGLWCSKRHTIRIPSVIAFASFVIFNVLMATVSSSTTESQIWGFPVFLGIGLGMCLTALITAAHFATPRELIAITSGLMISMRSLGGSVGLAIYNAVFSSGLSKNLGPEIAAAVLPKGFSPSDLPKLIPALMSHDDQALQGIPGATPEIIASGYAGLREAYLLSFRYVWVTAGCISFAALITSVFIQNPSEQFNSEIDAPIVTEPTVIDPEEPKAQALHHE
ncbi:MFS general substrate transporter [Sarocladium strictum]